MRVVRLIGVAIAIMLILNMFPLNTVGAGYSESQDLILYKEVLKRVLMLPDLNPQLRDRINNIINAHPSSRDEELQLINEAREILGEVEGYITSRMDLKNMVEKEKLERIIDSLSKYAEESKLEKVIKSLSEARKYLEEGEIEKAKAILRSMSGDIQSVKADQYSKELERSILTIFREASSNQTPIDSLLKAIENINITINILINVRGELVNSNASESSIMALDNAIEILYNVVSILNGTLLIVEKAGVHNMIGNVTEDLATKYIMDEIGGLRKKIKVLMNKTINIEDKLNITLVDIRNSLMNASRLLNESETALRNGNLEDSIRFLAMAKVIIHDVKESLKEYIEECEKEVGGGEMEEYIDGLLEEVKEEYRDVMEKYQSLYNMSIEYNSTLAMELLIQINITINNVKSIIVEAEFKLNESKYDDALSLLKQAESMLENVDSSLDEVEDILNIASETLNHVIHRIDELRDELKELNETIWTTFKGEILNKALYRVMNLNSMLDNAEELAKSGRIDEAVKIIDTVKTDIEGLKDCIEEVPRILDEVDQLRNEIDELRRKYSGVENVQKMLDNAEEMLDKVVALIEESIDECSPSILEKVNSIINEVKEIIESILEGKEYMISLMILDENGLPVLNSTIVFNGSIYHTGDIAIAPEGNYSLEVGNLSSGYMFDHWETHGDIKIMDRLKQNTTVSIEGDGAIILMVKKIYPSKTSYEVRFMVKDNRGSHISDAYLIFNGSRYYDGDYVEVPIGEYRLLAGSIPEGYEFSFWASEGDIAIQDPTLINTTAIVNGDGSITMVLKKVTKRANVKFVIEDVNGTILNDGSISFRGEKYASGENVTVEPDVYVLSVGELPEGYLFVMWKSTGGVTIADTYNPLTTVNVSGDGEIIMVVNKVKVDNSPGKANTYTDMNRNVSTLERLYLNYKEWIGKFNPLNPF